MLQICCLVYHFNSTPVLVHTIGEGFVTNSRSATTHVTGIETCLAHSVQVAQPSEEALEAETVATMGRAAVSGGYSVSNRFDML